MYIADGAIPELVREKRRNRFLFVSANVVRAAARSAEASDLKKRTSFRTLPSLVSV